MNLAFAEQAGRVCPADYSYDPVVFNRPPNFEARVLYVVGGLYGNPAAFDAVEHLAQQETVPAAIVFNGDFHWFDAEPQWFAAIEVGVGRHWALRGNVETELGRRDDVGAGCGCAYPPSVGEDVVRHSNEIFAELRRVATAAARRRLARLPAHLVAQVGALRVGVVHGDAASLAGWRFAQDMLDQPSRHRWLDDVRRVSNIDLFASTHTCLAALRDFELGTGRLTVINNGAAGMPNFAGSTFGLVTWSATACTLTPCRCTTTRARSWTTSWPAGRRARRPMGRISSASPAARTTQSPPHRDKIASRCPGSPSLFRPSTRKPASPTHLKR